MSEMGNLYFLLSEAYQGSKQYEESIVAINKAIEYEALAYYFNFKGDLYFDLQNYPESIKWYNIAIEMDPHNENYYTNRGKAYRFTDNELAILEFDKSLAIRVNSTAYVQKGYTLFDIQRYEEAIEVLQKGVLLSHDIPDAHCCIGDALDYLGRYEEAITAYDESLRQSEEDSITWNNKGVALNNLKRYEEAIVALDRSIELDPGDASSYCHKGYSYFLLGQLELAGQLYDAALSRNPEHEKAIERKQELQKALAIKSS